MMTDMTSTGKGDDRTWRGGRAKGGFPRVAILVLAVATALVCLWMLTSWATSPLGGVALAGETKQTSLDELTLTVLFGKTKEAEDAALELAGRADASRKWFEVFLSGFRRRDNLGVVAMCLDGARKWGKRHGKELKYLEEDANSFRSDRNFLASICLRTTETSDANLYVALHVGAILQPIEGKLFFVNGVDEPNTSWDKLFLRGIEGEMLLGRTCKAAGLEQGLPVAQAEKMIEKVTGLPVVWYPKQLRATKKIEVVKEAPALREGAVGVYQLLSGLVLAGAYDRPDVNATTSMVILTRRAIFIIGLPPAGAEESRSAKAPG